MTTITPDLQVENHGNIFLLTPLTPEGRQWAEENIAGDAMIWSSIVVDQHCIESIVNGADADGLAVRLTY